MMRRSVRRPSGIRTVALTLAGLVLPSAAFAQTSGTYIATASGNWSTPTNWAITSGPDPFPSNGGVAAFAGGSAATGFLTANVTVTQDVTPLSLSGINFNNVANGFAYSITGSPITLVAGGGGFATIGLNAASNINGNGISAELDLTTNLRFTSTPNILATYAISGVITGTNSVTVATSTAHDEAGFVTLSAQNTFTGGVVLQSGGLNVGASSTGTPGAITSGPLGTGTLTINGGNVVGGTFTVANDVVLNSTLIYSGGNGAFTSTGTISGAGGVTNRSRAGTLVLQGAETYSGLTAVLNEPVPLVNTPPNAGTITFSGAGTALNSSGFLAQANGTILLDNTANAANSIARIGATAPVTLNNGNFRINGSTAGTGNFTQSAGVLTVGGQATVIVNPATNEGLTLNFASLSRGAGNQRGTVIFNGGTASLGAAAGPGVPQVTFTTPPTLVGAGPLNTPSAPIIPFAIGSFNATGTGFGLVTYDTGGVRLLNQGTEYTTNPANLSATAGQNVLLLNTGTTTLTVTDNTANASVQSLFISSQSTATTNAGAVTLSGTGTLNITSGMLAVDSTVTAATGVVSSSSATAITQTINKNINFGSAEGVVFTAGALAVNLQINSAISGTNGLTKAGGGVLILTPTGAGNTYTGPTTINGGLVLINDVRALGADTSPIQFWSGSTSNNAGLQNTTAGLALNLTRDVVANDGLVALDASSPSRGVLIVSGTVSGAGTAYVTSANNGMTILAGNNTYTGETRVFSGVLAFASDANLGNGGAVDVGTNITGTNPPLGVRLFGNWTTSRLTNISSSSTFDTGPFNATLNGPLTEFGTDYIAKFGTGKLQFTNAQNGLLGMIVDNGTVQLSGAAHLLNATAGGVAINSGTLQLDYTTGTTPKLSNTQNVLFGGTPSGIANGGGGTLQLDAGTNAVSQTIGNIALALPATGSLTTAASIARVRMSAGSGGSMTLNASSLTYTNSGTTSTAGSSLFVAGDNLGTTTKLLFATGPTLVGGDYASSVGTPQLGILPGGYGDSTATGNGSGLITYDNTPGGQGVRLLAAGEYTNTTAGGPNNVRVSGSTATAGASDTINALVLQNAGTLTIPSGGTLTSISGMVLSAGTGPNVIQGDGTGGGGATLSGFGFTFAVPTDLTVRAVLSTGGPLTKTGPGVMTFNPLDASGASSTASTPSSVNIYEGTLQVTNPNASLSVLGTGNFFFANNARLRYANPAGASTAQVITLYGSGGTLDLTGSFLQTTATTAQITGSGALTLEGGSLVLGNAAAQVNNFQGGVNLVGGTIVLNSTTTAAPGPLGLGVLNLRGGQLAPRGATRTVANETAIFANTTFVNNLTFPGTLGTDASNAGLTFSVPNRLEASVTLTNNMTGGTLTYNGSIYDNPFNPPASLTLAAGAGAGPFVFANSNAYRGGTTVNSGATLRVTNTIGSGTGPGAVAVNSGGTLQGTGSIFPAAGNGVTVASGGTLQPGTPTAAGTLTVGTAAVPSSVNLSGTYLWNNSNAGTSSSTPGGSGGTVSLLAVNGGLTFAPQTFSINGLGTPNFNNAQPYSWTVASATGAIALGPQPTFLFTSNFTPATGGVYSLGTSGGAVFLNYSPVPEPTFVVLTCAGIAGMGTWWRRRTTRRA